MSETVVDIAARVNKNVNNNVDALYKIWLGMRDSNPRSWDQNPVPYRLANPQRRGYCSRISPEIPAPLG